MSRDEREDHTIERAVGLLEKQRGLLRREPSPAGHVRDLSHEARPEEEERLRALPERKAVASRFHSVLATECLRLPDELIASDRARRIEVPEEEVAHAH